MKRSLTLAALFLSLAPFAAANATIQKEAQKKDPKVSCKTCHSALPGTKANINEEGKKWVK